ncbi:MAG: type IX secretion system PorP/SprF family membrane protein [Glaciecola sp.]|jgi:type IX secretion system PorP/SprF family membrane protein
MKHFLSILFVLFFAHVCIAQDVHLSQYYHSPLLTNPALTGKHRQTIRLVMNQRQQWKSVTVPFTTFALSAETNRISTKKNISAGFSITNDKAGDSKLNTFQVNLSSAFVFSVNPDSSAMVRLGAQTGFTQKKIDFSDLRFDEQYNGFAFDPSLPNFEDQSNLKTSFANLNLGLDFDKEIDSRRGYGMGIGVFNLLNPAYNFLGDTQSKLENRLSTQAHYHQDIAKDWDIILSAQGMWQGSFREQIIGAMFKKIWRDDNILNRAGYIGAFMRVKDSGSLLLAMDYDDWKFGVSYDFNYSPLNVASRYRGGLELSVIYLIDIFNETIKPHRACPDFI